MTAIHNFKYRKFLKNRLIAKTCLRKAVKLLTRKGPHCYIQNTNLQASDTLWTTGSRYRTWLFLRHIFMCVLQWISGVITYSIGGGTYGPGGAMAPPKFYLAPRWPHQEFPIPSHILALPYSLAQPMVVLALILPHQKFFPSDATGEDLPNIFKMLIPW